MNKRRSTVRPDRSVAVRGRLGVGADADGGALHRSGVGSATRTMAICAALVCAALVTGFAGVTPVSASVVPALTVPAWTGARNGLATPSAAAGLAAAGSSARAGAASAKGGAGNTRASAAQVAAAGADPVSAGVLGAALAAGTLTPAQAVAQAAAEAAANGVTDYVSVADHAGTVLAQTANAGTQVASESIVKLMIASYYLVLVGGYQNQSPSVLSQLSFMIRYSDDATASAYFTSAAVPTIANRYGMRSTINATDRVGHWGAVRITAHDMTTFLFRALDDPEVGPWLGPVMAQVAPVGSDGFNQAFGMNSLTGVHGSKQGWGDDQFWSAADNVINSVGYTDRYFVAILQNSYSYPDPARGTSTFAAHAIAASRPSVARPAPPSPLQDGDFVRSAAAPGMYRMAGGAPIYVGSWGPFGGPKAVKTLSVAQWRALRQVPANGTFLRATGTGQLFRVAGGAPLYVSSWTPFGGVKPSVTVDLAALTHTGGPGVWSHLAAVPADGTFITTTNGQVFRIVAGTPTFVSSWVPFGGPKPGTVVDTAAVTHAGQPGVWAHLRSTIPDGIFVSAAGTGAVYVMAGGAPMSVATWSAFGGPKRTQLVDPEAIRRSGTGGQWSHIRAVPADGTFVKAAGYTYRIAGGAPLLVTYMPVLSTRPAITIIDPADVRYSGLTGRWSHLRLVPANGTYIRGLPTGKFYLITAGHPTIVRSAPRFVAVNQTTIDRAGRAAPFNHLK